MKLHQLKMTSLSDEEKEKLNTQAFVETALTGCGAPGCHSKRIKKRHKELVREAKVSGSLTGKTEDR